MTTEAILSQLSLRAHTFMQVAGGILFLSCSSVRPRVRPDTSLTRYLAEYLTHFHPEHILRIFLDSTNDKAGDK